MNLTKRGPSKRKKVEIRRDLGRLAMLYRNVDFLIEIALLRKTLFGDYTACPYGENPLRSRGGSTQKDFITFHDWLASRGTLDWVKDQIIGILKKFKLDFRWFQTIIQIVIYLDAFPPIRSNDRKEEGKFRSMCSGADKEYGLIEGKFSLPNDLSKKLDRLDNLRILWKIEQEERKEMEMRMKQVETYKQMGLNKGARKLLIANRRKGRGRSRISEGHKVLSKKQLNIKRMYGDYENYKTEKKRAKIRGYFK